MNLGEFRDLIKETHPRDWSDDDWKAFDDYLPKLSQTPDRTSEIGEALHRVNAYRDFRYFLTEAMGMGWKEEKIIRTGEIVGRGFVLDDPEWPLHDKMIDHLETVHNRKIVLSPRGSYKSTLVMYWLAWLIGRNPAIRILYNTETYSSARGYVQMMKSILIHPDYEEVFGVMRGQHGWSDSGLRVGPSYDLRTSKEPTLQPGGVDKGITGGHYELIVNDDVVSEINTRTRKGLEKTTAWYKMLNPILDPGALMLIVGTRYDDGDLLGHLEKNHHDSYEWLILEADNGDFKPNFKHLTEKFLREQRDEMGSYLYSCQYRNRPISHEDQLFFREQFRIIRHEDVPAGLNVYLLVDTATSVEGGLSRTAMAVVGLDSLRNIYVLDARLGKWKPSLVMENMFDLNAQWIPRHATMEQNAFADVYRALIDIEQRTRQVHLPVRALRNRQDRSKHQRILALQAPFEAGRVYFVDTIDKKLIKVIGTQAHGEIVEEFIRFPKGQHNDFADALSDVMWTDQNGPACPAPRHDPKRQVASSRPVHLDKPMVNGRYPEQMPAQARQTSRSSGLSRRRASTASTWRNKRIVG